MWWSLRPQERYSLREWTDPHSGRGGYEVWDSRDRRRPVLRTRSGRGNAGSPHPPLDAGYWRARRTCDRLNEGGASRERTLRGIEGGVG